MQLSSESSKNEAFNYVVPQSLTSIEKTLQFDHQITFSSQQFVIGYDLIEGTILVTQKLCQGRSIFYQNIIAVNYSNEC